MGLGFAGYAKIESSFVLCNTTGLEVQINPIYSAAVFGSGWYNAAAVTNFADNQLTYEGPIEFDLQGNPTIWDIVRDWAILRRAFPKSLELSPDGSVVYQYTFSDLALFDGAWNSALSLRFSPEAITKATANAIAIRRVEVFSDLQYFDFDDGGPAPKTGVGTPLSPVNPPTAPTGARNLNPIPGWNSRAAFVINDTDSLEVYAGEETDYKTEVMDYSFDITNNTQIVRTCNGKRIPSAVLQGTIDVTGSVTLYREGGIKDPVKLDVDEASGAADYVYADQTYLGINIGDTLFVKIPYALITSSDYGVKGQNEVSTRTFGIKGIGDGVEPPIQFPVVNPIPF